MNSRAFFFMDDMLLLPADLAGFLSGDSDTGKSALAAPFECELPIERAKEFTNPEIFEVQELESEPFEKTPGMISVVSVSKGVLPEGWKSILVRHALSIMSAHDSYISRMLRCLHIARWRKESRFCGSCGCENLEPLINLQRECPNCGRLEFPRICPAVITLITDEQNRILLAHNKNFRSGMYSHIAGFNEAGESLEKTAAREIHEEIGVSVKDIVYIKSQPWPFPNSLMMGFKARYCSGTIKPDGVEIEDARWFTKDNLPELPGEGSLSRFLINSWFEGTL